jgi:hypothetical protein
VLLLFEGGTVHTKRVTSFIRRRRSSMFRANVTDGELASLNLDQRVDDEEECWTVRWWVSCQIIGNRRAQRGPPQPHSEVRVRVRVFHSTDMRSWRHRAPTPDRLSSEIISFCASATRLCARLIATSVRPGEIIVGTTYMLAFAQAQEFRHADCELPACTAETNVLDRRRARLLLVWAVIIEARCKDAPGETPF